MTNFTAFTDILPTPSSPIGYAGQSLAVVSGGKAGPGYASVKVEAEYQTMSDRTNSGRLVSRANAYHQWKVDITYNPMTRVEFSPVYSFLLEKQGMLRPFFVTLPQHVTSQDTTLTEQLWVNNGTDTEGALTGYAAGKTYLRADGSSGTYDSDVDGYPKPGDMFTFTDTNNTNHKKAYKITRVETWDTANTNLPGYPSSDHQLRIHFTPPLQRFTSNNAEVIYTNPKIKVIMANDVVGYQLKTDNLYVFSLNLEEVQ